MLEAGIQDYADNITRFLIVTRAGGRRGAHGRPPPDKTTVVFTLPNTPGCAVQGAQRLRAARHRRHQDRIAADRPPLGVHVLPGHRRRRSTKPRCSRALTHLAEFAPSLKTLGSYPGALCRAAAAASRRVGRSRRHERSPLKHRSAALTEGPSRAAARAMFKAVGFSDADLHKPLVGIANTWTEIGPCNFHLRRLAAQVKEGVREAGGTPMEFNTVAVSDGITMGAEGMRASLVSREVIADSIELVVRGHHLDAVVLLCGCDKTIPGTVMALARLNLPGVVLYGGSIAPGTFEGRDVTIQDVFEAVGAHAAGRMNDAQLRDLEDHACPGAGACGGQFTANTMAMACEFLGVSPFGSAVGAGDARREGRQGAVRPAASRWTCCGAACARATSSRATRSRTPSPASSPAAARPTPCCTCWRSRARPASPSTSTTSTRSAIARRCIVDLKPGGRYVATDLYRAGGMPLVAQRLVDGRPAARRTR